MNKPHARIRTGGEITYKTLTSRTWPDLEALFGERGACGGCWCMYWRLRRSDYDRSKGEGNRKKFRKLVEAGAVPGILLYVGGNVAGWCAVAPREEFSTLEHSRILKRVDNEPVWSIVCFFIAREYRRKGLSTGLIRQSAEYAFSKGARIVEAYPVDVESTDYPVVFAHVGFKPAFDKAGFKEVARRSRTRPVMRYSR